MCSAVKYSRGQLLRDVCGWTRHKKEKKRVGDEMVCFDELSRSGVLEETQHVYNAALIQLTLPICRRSDEEKIDAHVPSELYNFLSWIMTGKIQDMAPCLNKRVELDNCFSSCFFFLMYCSISFPLFALLNSAIHVDI